MDERTMSNTAQNPKLVPADENDSRPRRRVFTGAYKAAILAECDAVTEPGQIGAILRREGLYSSHLVDWRRKRTEGGMALLAQKRGRPPKDPTLQDSQREVERLRRENAALLERLRRAEIIVEAQKKLAMLLGPDPTSEGSSR